MKRSGKLPVVHNCEYIYATINLYHLEMSENQEKARLLHESERMLDGTSMATGASIHSGGSLTGVNSSQQHRLQVQAEMCKRRPSVESGVLS